jgi:hypothetical protein
VGVLLFGTPLLLMLNYDFIYALNILLPISMVINFFQIVQYKKYIDFGFYKTLLKYSILPIVLALYFTVKLNIDVSLYIGLFLVFISLKLFSSGINEIINFLFKNDKLFFLIMGCIHGITNLGGSLLTSKIFSLSLSKQEKRATISISYFTFALFQLIIIHSMGNSNFFNIYYLFLGLFIYVLIDKLIYNNITDTKYDNIFAIFLFISGVVLIYKGW